MITTTNYELVYTDKLIITCSDLPQPYARSISPFDSNEVAKEKELLPFKLRNKVDVEIIADSNKYTLNFEAGFIWNGASIPSWLWVFAGSNADPKYLTPSMVHDLLCNNHNLINNDRALSSLIFKELLLACKVPKYKANLMYMVVDNFQKLPMCKW